MVGKRTAVIETGVIGAAEVDELLACAWRDINVVGAGNLPRPQIDSPMRRARFQTYRPQAGAMQRRRS